MKKTLLFIIFILFLFPLTVFAEDKVEIKSITFVEKSDNTVINSEATTDGENINLDLVFFEKDDYATYKVLVKNPTSTSLFINDKYFNKDNENISYEFLYSDGNNIIKAGEEKTFNMRVSYSKTIDRDLFRNNKYEINNNEPLVLSDKLLNVPNTLKNIGILGGIILIIVFIALFVGIYILFRTNKNSGINILIIGLLLIVLPKGVDALFRVDIPVNSNILIKMVKPNNCVFEGDLVPGARYDNGQYSYYYKMRLSPWNNPTLYSMDEDGWSMTLTDKNSTDPVISKVCTFINGIPVTDFSNAFNGSNAEVIDTSSWDLSNVTNLQYAFYGSNVKELDFRGFDTSNVTSMYAFLNAARQLNRFDAPNLDLSNVTTIDYLLSNAYSSAEDVYINVDNWYFPKVTRMEQAFFTQFYSATSSVKLYINNWDVSKIADNTKYFYMFALHAPGDIYLEAKNWNFNGATSIDDAFRLVGEASNSITVDVTGWDVSTITKLNYAFEMLGNQARGDIIIKGLETWDTSNVTEMYETFYSIGRQAKSIKMDVSKWDVSKVETMYSMFYDTGGKAESFEIGDLSNWNLISVTNMSGFMYYIGTNYYGPNLYNIGTINIKHECDISNMFSEMRGAVVTLNLYKKPSYTSRPFSRSSFKEGAQITVNYTSEVDNIDSIIASSNYENNVVKGELIE